MVITFITTEIADCFKMATDVDEVVRQALSSSRIEWVSDVSGGIVNAGNAKVYEVDTGKIFVKYNTTSQVTDSPLINFLGFR